MKLASYIHKLLASHMFTDIIISPCSREPWLSQLSYLSCDGGADPHVYMPKSGMSVVSLFFESVAFDTEFKHSCLTCGSGGSRSQSPRLGELKEA